MLRKLVLFLRFRLLLFMIVRKLFGVLLFTRIMFVRLKRLVRRLVVFTRVPMIRLSIFSRLRKTIALRALKILALAVGPIRRLRRTLRILLSVLMIPLLLLLKRVLNPFTIIIVGNIQSPVIRLLRTRRRRVPILLLFFLRRIFIGRRLVVVTRVGSRRSPLVAPILLIRRTRRRRMIGFTSLWRRVMVIRGGMVLRSRSNKLVPSIMRRSKRFLWQISRTVRLLVLSTLIVNRVEKGPVHVHT